MKKRNSTKVKKSTNSNGVTNRDDNNNTTTMVKVKEATPTKKSKSLVDISSLNVSSTSPNTTVSSVGDGEQQNNNKSETKTHDSKSTKHQMNIENGRYDDPCHEPRPSLLSSNSGYTNYRGLLNLCIVLLVMSMTRLVLENIIKYGLLVRFDIPLLFIQDPTAWPSLLAIVCANIFVLFVYYVEKAIANKKISENFGIFLGIIDGVLALSLPAIYLWYKESNPASAFMALSGYICISLKIFSYIHVNKMCRANIRKTKLKSQSTSAIESHQINKPHNETLVHYPDNLNLNDLYYYMFAPTLCYELNFPRTERVHIRFIVRRLCEVAFLGTLQYFLIQQWIVPILKNSKQPFRESSASKIAERLLKLAVPNHVIWVIFFYSYFHTWLNLVAEVMRFGDREFYRDWWNAENVNEFWQNWNIPVHRFCVRHIYKPLVRHGRSKLFATVIVFMVSAFFHEYLVSLPLRMFRLWSFFGMLFQVPFALFVQKYLHGHYGNMALWLSLIIGQPLAIMMYIHDYYIDYYRHV